MAEQLDPGFVRVIHPGLGDESVSVVPESSLPQLYEAGWTRLKDDPPPPPPPPEPEPMTRTQAAKTAAKAAGPSEE